MLEELIKEWRSFVLRKRAIDTTDVDELEDHLRDQVADLQAAGLADDEAFIISVKRLGELDKLSREFAREHSERLWKRLVITDADNGGDNWRQEALVALALALAAALAIKLPGLFGISFDGPESDQLFYAKNFSLFVLPFLAGFFAWKRGMEPAEWLLLAVAFIVGALVINLFPFSPGGHTELLATLHLPLALWFMIGISYAGGDWRSHDQRMNFIRFSGEWFIYLVLIGLGGSVLMVSTMFIFSAIGLDAEWLLNTWILPCGSMGAIIIASWLVEAKQSVIENIAPVLTMLFTPLFTLMLLAFLVTVLWTGSGIEVERDALIGFDLLLVVVAGLLLYAVSARDPQAESGIFDIMQLTLVVCALLVDGMALWAILARISEFGFSPNRVAALGENLILVVTLGRSAVLYARFINGRGGFMALERWQTAYLPVYALWMWTVVVIFPLLFQFQ